MNSRVLLTNGHMRKTLAAARSLASRGVKVFVAEETTINLSAFSKYCKYSLAYPSPAKKPQQFYLWLLDTIKTHLIDVVFPMDDDVMQVVMQHREELQKICSIPVPSQQSYSIAADKGKCTLFMKEAGLDCPDMVIPSGPDTVLQDTAHMNYPVIIKPTKSSGSRGIRIVDNKQDLLEVYSYVHSIYPYPIVQEYIGIGDKFDVCLLYDNSGQLKASFAQKEIRHFPVDIGPSTVQESIAYPELIERSVDALKQLNWTGIVELEFMVDKRDGKVKFMEINPRFWNSLYAAIISGVDFPWLLFRIANNQHVDRCTTYRAGIKCRWLLPGDILHFITNNHRQNMRPPFLHGKKDNIYDDIISTDDPMPVIGFLLSCVPYLFNKEKWDFVFKR